MKIHILSLLSSCVLIAATLGGCSSNTGNAPTTAPPAVGGNPVAAGAGKQLHLAFVTNNTADYWNLARKGAEKAQAEMPNVQLDFKMPGQGTAAEQTDIVDDMLAKGVDGIAISPVDPANETGLLNKAAAQGLVFTQDSDAPKSNRACYIGTDNVAAGRLAGEMVKKALPNGGSIMVFVGKIDAQNAKERYQGLQDVLKGTKVRILDVRTDDADQAKAKSNVSDALVKYSDLAGCVGLWGYNGPAILSALADAGKVGKVKIVCFDQADETMAGLKSGAISATIVQDPYQIGYQAISNMAKYLGGDKSVVPVGKQIFIPTEAVTQATADAYKAKLDKLKS